MPPRISCKLTGAKVRAASSNGKPMKLCDGQGLYLYVTPRDYKSWRYAYRYNGKARTLVIGPYPLFSLKDAREAHIDARRLLAKGISPAAAKRERKLAGSGGRGEG